MHWGFYFATTHESLHHIAFVPIRKYRDWVPKHSNDSHRSILVPHGTSNASQPDLSTDLTAVGTFVAIQAENSLCPASFAPYFRLKIDCCLYASQICHKIQPTFTGKEKYFPKTQDVVVYILYVVIFEKFFYFKVGF
jgi:hypothetical protein